MMTSIKFLPARDSNLTYPTVITVRGIKWQIEMMPEDVIKYNLRHNNDLALLDAYRIMRELEIRIKYLETRL